MLSEAALLGQSVGEILRNLRMTEHAEKSCHTLRQSSHACHVAQEIGIKLFQIAEGTAAGIEDYIRSAGAVKAQP